MGISVPLSITLGIAALIGFSCFGSSFVEEEHQLWWWIITISISSSYIISLISGRGHFWPHFIVFFGVRLIRGWNNTGQQTVYNYVISQQLQQEPAILWALNIWTVFVVCIRDFKGNPVSFISSFTLGMMVITYKMSWAIVNKEGMPEYLLDITRKYCVIYTGFNDESVFDQALIPMATLFFRCFASITVIKFIATALKMQKSNTLMNDMTKYITLLLIFLSPSANIPQYLVFELMRYAITPIMKKQYSTSVYAVSLVSLVLQNFTFFQFGGTNSIATIDLANAYHGVSENYNIYLIGVMMAVANFAPAIYWAMFPWAIIYNRCDKKGTTFGKNKLPILIFSCVVGCCLLAACVALRYHLFIWSVFSPKLCYYAGWAIFMNVIMGYLVEGPLLMFN